MALLRTLSIKWKLSLALLLTGLLLVAAYIAVAKRVFESDKIAYVFEAQGTSLEATKREIEGRVQKILWISRSIVFSMNAQTGEPSLAGKRSFQDELALGRLELWSETRKERLFRLEKQVLAVPAPSFPDSGSSNFEQVVIQRLNGEHLLLEIRSRDEAFGVIRLRAAVRVDGLVPKASPSQSLAFIQGTELLEFRDVRGLAPAIARELASEMKNDVQDRTTIWTRGKQRFLVSESRLSFGDLRLLAVTPEVEALGALGTLFQRSLIFLVFSTFGLVFVSLTLARGLTHNLAVLTVAAGDIGRGRFDAVPEVQSEDEMGVLARAFKTMSVEIERLINQTKEKVRMEEELKTASLVQAHLFPNAPSATLGTIEVSGSILSSSECGGDWWYYYEQGDDLYVAIADATGHGTPAALITAVARSVFSRLENERLTLREAMRAWDQAVSKCSHGSVFMTAIFLKINTVTGKGRAIQAAHEQPFLVSKQSESQFECSTLDVPPSSRLGDGKVDRFHEYDIDLKPDDYLVLYSDGLFAVEKPGGKVLRVKRVARLLTEKASAQVTAQSMTHEILGLFNEFRENAPIPDDISIVTIRRLAAAESSQEESERRVAG